MKVKYLSVFILLCFFSCKKEQENSELIVVKKNDSLLIKEKDIVKLQYTDYILDDRTGNVVERWLDYTKLQEVINNVKKGDLSFFKGDAQTVRDLLKNLKQTIPYEVNTPSILARIAALETKVYKLESISKLPNSSKSELLELTKELLTAFSNLNLQMNKKLEADNIIIEKP